MPKSRNRKISHSAWMRAKRQSNATRRLLTNRALDLVTRANMILLAVLAQKGGEVVVTDGTLEQVGANLQHLDYAIVNGENKGEHIVRIVEGKEETPAENPTTEAEAEPPTTTTPENGIQ